MTHICISLITYNGHKDTIACLQSLKKIKKTGITLTTLVIDNNSTDVFSVNIDEYKDLGLHIIRIDKNKGFAGGHNRAIAFAKEKHIPFILILNNDTIVDPDFLVELLKPMNEKAVAIAVPKIYFAKGQEFHKDRYKENELGKVIWYAGAEMDWKNLNGFHRGVDEVDTGQYNSEEETAFATGCCMLVRMAALETVGAFDERYFLYYEDSDLTMRMKKQGYKVVYVPTAYIWHKNAGSTGGSGSALQDYYITRNRLLFGMTYASRRTKLALLKESGKLFFTGRQWQKRAVQDFYLHKLGKGSYGT